MHHFPVGEHEKVGPRGSCNIGGVSTLIGAFLMIFGPKMRFYWVRHRPTLKFEDFAFQICNLHTADYLWLKFQGV